MQKKGWTKIVVRISSQEWIMLAGALNDENIEVVYEPPPSANSRGARVERNSQGEVFFVPNNLKLLALEVINQFFKDFNLEDGIISIETM